MSELIQDDLHHVLSRVPKDVRKLLQEGRLFLGGGFIRCVITGEQINDIDLFGPTREQLEIAGKTFALARKARFHTSDNAFTVLTPGRHAVQFIHRWLYTDPAKLIEEFDFSIAQAVIWWQPEDTSALLPTSGEWRSLVSDSYYADLASKRLRYLSPARAEDAGGSILRMRKFISRGYHIEAFSLGKVIARLVRGVRDSATANESEEGLGKVLTGLLREVDPLTIVDGLELVDEHQATTVEPELLVPAADVSAA